MMATPCGLPHRRKDAAMVATTSIVSELLAARDRGAAWLASQQRDDGAIGQPEKYGLGPYYKALWAFAASGRSDAGNRLASWVRRELVRDDGDLAGPLRDGERNGGHDRNYAYPNAWLLIGAHLLGRYDITSRGIPFLLRLQHPESGGFRMQRDRLDAVQDVLNASQAANACLLTGHIDRALRAGAFLRTVWEAQPRPERELFFVWKPGEGLRTEFPEERQYLHSIRVDAPRQPYFNSGIAAAFLCRLAMATGEAEWVELAKRYLEISFHTLDEMYETAQVGKVGWGAALIYALDGGERYARLAERVGRAMIAQQADAGGWDNTGGYVNDAIRQEVTGEFVVLLDEMAGGLSSKSQP
jgi:hypothetical protein